MKAIVADDHPIIRETAVERLRTRFGPEATVVGVSTYDALLLMLDLAPADLIVADLDMPDLGPGRTLASVLRKAGETPVVVFSSSSSPPVVRAIAQQGARGFVCKTETLERLIEAVETVLAGGTDFPEADVGAETAPLRAAAMRAGQQERLVGAHEIAHEPDAPKAPCAACERPHDTLERKVDRPGDRPDDCAAALHLTKRQREILRCVAQGLSNKQIARRLGISDSTVKVHMHGLFARLGVQNRTQAAMLSEESRAVPTPSRARPSLVFVR